MTWSMSTKCDGSTSSRRGRICGTLTRAKPRSPVSGSRKPTAIDRLSVEMYGNGWPGSTASGVRTGKISSRKRWRSASWCSGMAAYSTSSTPSAASVAADVHEDRRVVGHELEHALARGRELFLGGPAVGRAGDLAGLDLLAQAGHAHLEELVEVAREDGQELDPFEQRVALVARLVQHPRVEFEPRQLAVDVRERDLGTRGAARTRGDDGACGTGGDAWIDRGHGLVSGLFVGVTDVRRPGGRG